MTLYELSGEYLKEEEKLTRQIKNYIPIVKELSGEQKHTANRRLMCLYEMRREVRITACTLANYYKDKSDLRLYHKNNNLFCL